MRSLGAYILWMLVSCLAGGRGARAQPSARAFERIGSEDGLSHNSVYAVTEDREGFLWIGTVDGLNRYDGYTFSVYRHDPADSASLSNSLINALHVDRAGQLWVRTNSGLNRDDPATDRFVLYALTEEGTAGGAVYTLFEDRGGALWVGNEAGLVQLDTARTLVAVYRHNPDETTTLRLRVPQARRWKRALED